MDLVAITETWLKPYVMNCELLPGLEFTIHRRDRESKTGGGVMLAVKNNIHSVRRKDLESNAELLACELRPDARRKILVMVFYRPPDSDLVYIKEFKKSLHLASQAKFDQLIICGDFNLPNIDWKTGFATQDDCLHSYFTKLLRDNFLWQMVQFPTRNNNILDLVLTNIPNKLSNFNGFVDIISTDHLLISFNIDLKIPKKTITKRSVYNYKKADWSGLKEALRNTPWDLCFIPDDINASLANWCDVFLAAVNDHIPKCKIRNTSNHPWIDNEILSVIRKKNMQRKKSVKSGSLADTKKFKDLRRLTKQLISKKKKDHAHKLRDSLIENPKRFWSFVKSSTTEKISSNFLRDGDAYITDKYKKANLLNSFFHSMFSPATPASTTDVAEGLSHARDTLSSLQLTDSEVRKVLKDLDPNKASGPDEIPSTLLKNTANEIAPSLCRLFNQSLSLNTVPLTWKRANVTPVFKKDDPTLASNYRPISLLCIISKVLERCVFDHSCPHLCRSFYNLQHGFLKGRSTVTQLLHVYHEMLDSLASGKELDSIYLDLAKAFDRVPHQPLITKLERYGISGTLLLWFDNYLTERTQRVVLDGTSSDWLPVTSGVPQGSILGPLLFLTYINDMPDYISEGSMLALFADDSKLYRTINSASSCLQLQTDLNSLHLWSSDWNMAFNPSKCKALHISKKTTKRIDTYSYNLDGQHLEYVPYIKDLGITVSNDLQWSRHIEEISSKANQKLGLIKRVCGRNITNTNTRKTLYLSLVRPRLEYASNVWSPHTVKYQRCIENVQRRATKFILNYPPKDISYSERLSTLNLLPLQFRREISDLMFLCKYRTGLLDTDLSKFFVPTNSHYNTRNSDTNNYRNIWIHKQNYFKNSYFPRTVKLWNKLPANIKTLESLYSFRKAITEHYRSKMLNYKPP